MHFRLFALNSKSSCNIAAVYDEPVDFFSEHTILTCYERNIPNNINWVDILPIHTLFSSRSLIQDQKLDPFLKKQLSKKKKKDLSSPNHALLARSLHEGCESSLLYRQREFWNILLSWSDQTFLLLLKIIIIIYFFNSIEQVKFSEGILNFFIYILINKWYLHHWTLSIFNI